jgi:DNA segregation ATPase FtsK/SpoIIIE-like protein
LIKANLPSRISFRVSSKIDSRTILDGNGAEQLLGKGDMLFLPPASSRCIRLHGPYISEQESARLASFLRKQGKPIFDDSITAEDEKSALTACSSRRTISMTRPRASLSAAARCRSRTCSGSCASASAARRGWST